MNELQLSSLTYKDLEKAINQFQSMDFKNTSIAEAYDLLRLIMPHFRTLSLVLNAPIVFRARRHSSDKLFENTEELIYPKITTAFGRLNDIGESLFYGSHDRDVALFEMRPQLGEEFTILQSRLIDSNNGPKFMEIAVRELMVEQNHSHDFIKKSSEILERNISTTDNKRRYKLINDFLVREITKVVSNNEPYNYKGSIAIAQFFSKWNTLVDGMIYPSIAASGGVCIAIKPTSYDRLYFAEICAKVKVEEIDADGLPTYSIVEISEKIDTNGLITWT
jgi:hypothetical protein